MSIWTDVCCFRSWIYWLRECTEYYGFRTSDSMATVCKTVNYCHELYKMSPDAESDVGSYKRRQ